MEPETLELTAVESRPEAIEGESRAERLMFRSSVGDFQGRLIRGDADAAVLWVFGAGGGLGGPAGGVYARLGGRLAAQGATSLELDYRRPGSLRDCVVDVIFAAAFLDQLGARRLVLVGHSFGGAVVIGAAAMLDDVVGVAALSPQTLGADDVAEISPRPMLFIHGSADEVLTADCSRELHRRAGPPKRLILYPGCGHGLDECRDQLDRDLGGWIKDVLRLG